MIYTAEMLENIWNTIQQSNVKSPYYLVKDQKLYIPKNINYFLKSNYVIPNYVALNDDLYLRIQPIKESTLCFIGSIGQRKIIHEKLSNQFYQRLENKMLTTKQYISIIKTLPYWNKNKLRSNQLRTKYKYRLKKVLNYINKFYHLNQDFPVRINIEHWWYPNPYLVIDSKRNITFVQDFAKSNLDLISNI